MPRFDPTEFGRLLARLTPQERNHPIATALRVSGECAAFN